MSQQSQHTTTHSLRVDSRIFTRTSHGTTLVEWLGHGTTETGDPTPRPLTEREKGILAEALLEGCRWRAV
jgi:hypothetical protein